jgi:hypothetical protein
MGFTPNWSLIYLDPTVHKYISADNDRKNWMFLDSQLYGLSTMMGGGVISGWVVAEGTGLSVTIGVGSGFVGGYYAETVVPYSLDVPASSTVYIYAAATSVTPVTGEVEFFASTSLSGDSTHLLISEITTDTSAVDSIDDTVRYTVGWSYELQHYLDTHVHDGDPISLIDLSSHVTGILSSDHIGTIDASKITGLLNESNIPQISHTALQDIGRYTHDQIDSLLDTVQDDRYKEFGDILSVVELQRLLAHAHIYYDPTDTGGYFRFIPNTILLIPGITCLEESTDTPNFSDLLDYTLTTATIDETNHVFLSSLGELLLVPKVFSRVWNSTNWDEIVSYSNVDIDDTITLHVSDTEITREESGTVSFKYDTGRVSIFGIIEWLLDSNDIDDPISVKARSASTSSGLDSAAWSDSFTTSGSTLPVQANRWIEVEITLQTDDVTITPELDWVEINYYSITAGCGRALWPSIESFSDGVFTDTELDSNIVKLSTGGTGTYESSGTAESSIMSIGSGFVKWNTLTWDRDLPTNTVVGVKYKTGASVVECDSADWSSQYTDGVGGVLIDSTDEYIQLQVLLSTTDDSVTPVMDYLTLTYYST